MNRYPKPIFCLLLLLPFICLCGCERNFYQVLLQPEADGVKRQLTCWRADPESKTPEQLNQFSQTELERIAAVYATDTPAAAAEKFTFTGHFQDEMPADIGGAGRLARYHSPLGTLTVYAERFRGEADQAQTIQTRRRATDQLAELVIGWLAAEAGNQTDWARVEKVLRNDVRQDLRNTVVHVYLGNILTSSGLPGQPAQEEVNDLTTARVMLQLIEQNYLDMTDIPTLGTLFNPPSEDAAWQAAQTLVTSALARKSGLPPDAPVIRKVWEAIVKTDTAEETFTSHVRTTALWKAWAAERKHQDAAAETEPTEMLEELVGQMFDVDIFATNDQLTVRLECTTEPFSTNGTWDAAASEIAWQMPINPANRLPTFAYASWADPAADYQEQHFGQVLLRDKSLSNYVLWYQALTPQQRQQWDTFINQLRPEPEMAPKIRQFCLAGEAKVPAAPTENEIEASLVQPARQLILDALEQDN
jgi:hypothetical protein